MSMTQTLPPALEATGLGARAGLAGLVALGALRALGWTGILWALSLRPQTASPDPTAMNSRPPSSGLPSSWLYWPRRPSQAASTPMMARTQPPMVRRLPFHRVPAGGRCGPGEGAGLVLGSAGEVMGPRDLGRLEWGAGEWGCGRMGVLVGSGLGLFAGAVVAVVRVLVGGRDGRRLPAGSPDGVPFGPVVDDPRGHRGPVRHDIIVCRIDRLL